MAPASHRPSSPDSTASRAREPLWTKVQNDLERRIQAGDFTDGFPGELELSKHYGVSRSTVRAALTPLRRNGRITAQRGRPSQVVNVYEEHTYGPIYSLFAAVEGAGMTQRSTVRSAAMSTSAEAAQHLALEPDTELVHLVRTRYADDEPFAEDEVWLAPVARGVLDIDLRHTALYEALHRCCGLTLTAGQETLHSVNLSAEQATRLSCPPGCAAFYIERLGMIDDTPLEWRRTLVRGDRFTVSTVYP